MLSLQKEIKRLIKLINNETKQKRKASIAPKAYYRYAPEELDLIFNSKKSDKEISKELLRTNTAPSKTRWNYNSGRVQFK